MKITITKKQEYVNGEPKPPRYFLAQESDTLTLTEEELLQLRDELNKVLNKE